MIKCDFAEFRGCSVSNEINYSKIGFYFANVDSCTFNEKEHNLKIWGWAGIKWVYRENALAKMGIPSDKSQEYKKKKW